MLLYITPLNVANSSYNLLCVALILNTSWSPHSFPLVFFNPCTIQSILYIGLRTIATYSKALILLNSFQYIKYDQYFYTFHPISLLPDKIVDNIHWVFIKVPKKFYKNLDNFPVTSLGCPNLPSSLSKW